MDAALAIYNVGMEDAAKALSRLTGREVRVDAPRLFRDGAPFALDDRGAVGVKFQVVGELAAEIFILFSDADARNMLGLLLGEEHAASGALSALEASALEEVGNILASARLNALAVLFKRSLLPSPPELLSGAVFELLARARERAAGTGASVAIESPFSIAAPACHGSFYLFAAPDFLHEIAHSAAR